MVRSVVDGYFRFTSWVGWSGAYTGIFGEVGGLVRGVHGYFRFTSSWGVVRGVHEYFWCREVGVLIIYFYKNTLLKK